MNNKKTPNHVEMPNSEEPIAIIGTGCRFPGNATTPSRFWDLIQAPRDLLTEISVDRFSVQSFHHENGQYHGHGNAKHAYLLAEQRTQRHFDARFFNINVAEAETLDPQMRQLLETVYEALEASGHTIEQLQGSDTAVYTGLMVADYEQMMLRDQDCVGTYHGTGTSRSLMSNRISYFFDWHGPSMTIDTACSSSLVAVHQAVQQLRSGQSRVAVAAGANLILDPVAYISFSKLRMLSPDGRSRMWDASANGYARGEGIGAVVLKTLKSAQEDGDHIECIIRETGVNQDGKTPGLTVPSPAAQARLIRDCYSRAGLDPSNPLDRPQYFEAHGTGTLAGDPVEAEAISSAFFLGVDGQTHDSGPLFVGSIKTIIGHTEGTAGLAALLKASLAVQNSVIPPNLLLNRLNPKIAPFYTNLRVPTSATPWPTVTGVRRASVNSFGFGGTNAHAIVENYTPVNPSLSTVRPLTGFMPFVFSAATRTSLLAHLAAFVEYLEANQAVLNVRDLAYTLYSRRTRFSVSTYVVASTARELEIRIKEKIQNVEARTDQLIEIVPPPKGSTIRHPRVLGVFTGQGAQWALQGRELLISCPAAWNLIEMLERRLSRLPPQDRPSWSLLEELQKEGHDSRIGQAEFSQPLCTAIQIMLLNLLQDIGVELSAVVGHSSGEIAAAYAAGRITHEDAICIAYYRGLYSKLAQGQGGQSGAMMAVGTSFEDIRELCQSPEFEGRVFVAAINSSTSVTVSGDSDAIMEMKIILDDENKYTRILKIDKAYHSIHMSACSKPYLQALEALGIQPGPPCAPTWFSSVYGRDMAKDYANLGAEYWDSNLTCPVQFSQAVRLACDSMGSFDCVVEVGPHPSLKGPTLQTLHDTTGHDIPYMGLLRRGENALETLAESFGSIWSHLGPGSVDLNTYGQLITGNSAPYRLIKGLPTYSWDHTREYWHDTRYSRAQKDRIDSVHALLGHLTPDSTEQEIRWRQIIRPTEIQWLQGHRLQGEIVFPAAAYIVLALEAALWVARDSPIVLVEIADVEIVKAMIFDHEDTSIEALLSLTNITRDDNKKITASFKYSAADAQSSNALDLLASGHLQVTLGECSVTSLPFVGPRLSGISVQPEDFYASMRQVEYQYLHPFTALRSLERRLGTAAGFISNVESAGLLLHPAILDAAFQSIFLAHSFPGDSEISTMHVPKTIRSVKINTSLYAAEVARAESFPFHATQPGYTTNLTGDVDIYPNGVRNAMVQIEGLVCVPLAEITAEDDKEMFSTTIWDVANPDLELSVGNPSVSPHQNRLAHLLERVAYFYLRTLDQKVPQDHASRSSGQLPLLFKFASHVLALSRSDQLPLWVPEWEQDTLEGILTACESYSHAIDVKLLCAIGGSLIDISMGTKQAIEVGMEDNLLAQYYEHALEFSIFTEYLAKTVKQITHRHPHMKILEIGAGTGAATKGILKEINEAFGTYTFTDISSGFFDPAKTLFDSVLHKTVFNVLDISRDVCQQGFAGNSYDLVIASMVLHATPVLEDTLRNVRRLLKPGGYLVVTEGLLDTACTTVRLGTIFGAFPGWWVGSKEGRGLSPFIDQKDWDYLLRKTGFSGCDSITPDFDPLVMPLTVFVTQAVDDRVLFLRDPLSASSDIARTEQMITDLIILGGNSLRISQLVGRLQALLRRHCHRIIHVRTLEETSSLPMTSTITVLNLTDLDEPFFMNPSNEKWDALKRMILHIGCLLSVTHGRREANPYANMTLGLLRCSLYELPALRVQFMDFDGAAKVDAQTIAETLMRLNATSTWQKHDSLASLLTTIEPELSYDEQNRELIARLMVATKMNNRYNALRRPFVSDIELDTHTISLVSSDDGYVLCRPSLVSPKEMGRIRLLYSLPTAVKVSQFGSMFLCLGIDCSSNEQVIGLSLDHASYISPNEELSIPIGLPLGSEPKFLMQVAYRLVASTILRDLLKGDRVLVHEPTPNFATVLTEKADHVGVKVTFTTCCTANTNPGWLNIHPEAPARDLRLLIPKRLSAYVDLTKPSETCSIGSRICSLLPVHCRREALRTLFGEEAWDPGDSHMRLVRMMLQEAVQNTRASVEEIRLDFSIVATSSLPGCRTMLTANTMLDWTSGSCASVPRPIESQLQFSKSKTYWLAGLSRGLGLSLCEWLVHHGARHVVLSSRQPKIDELWMSRMSTAGAVIRILPCDITDKREMIRLHDEICANMPPIGGVVQGAMVLQDTPLRDMTLDKLLKVTKPKVEGSINLSHLFPANTLDFFVFFSSASSVVGNPGQSNYSAANLFMSSLAENRRRRGLAASVMNIGPVLGVGYIAEENCDLKGQMQSGSWVFISERDFHKQFAEAVIAGRPGSLSPIEVTSGLRRVDPHDKVQPTWVSNPYMSHFIRNRERSNPCAATIEPNVSIKAKLAQAQNKDDVLSIIRHALIPKLCALYQLDADRLSQGDLDGMQLSGMGTDSLLAIEIRGWFMRTLQVNIPVLKILSGTTIGDLLNTATDKILPELVPKLKESESSSVTLESESFDFNHMEKPSGSQDWKSLCEISGSTESPGSPTPASSLIDNAHDEAVQTITPQEPMKLSFSQEMFWFVWAFLKDKTSLNHTGSFRLTGRLNYENLQYATMAVGQQQEILRTRFLEKEDTANQIIMESSKVCLERRQINDEAEVAEVVEELEKHIFDLEGGETMRLILMSLSESTHFLVMSSHSLIMDGWSFQVFLKELQEHYVRPGQYYNTSKFSDYSVQQHADYSEGNFQRELDFWKAELSPLPTPLPILRLSKITSRPVLTTYENERADIRIERDTKDRIHQLCRTCKVTPFHFYLAVFRVLLLRYTGEEFFSVGIGDSNRTEDEAMSSIGVFVNLLPLCFRTVLGIPFIKLLSETRDKAYFALANSRLPFQVLLNELNVARSATCTPIFQCFIDYRSGHRERTTWADCSLEMLTFQASKLAYDVALDIIDDPNGDSLVMLIVRKDLYCDNDARFLAHSFECLVNAFAEQPDMLLSEPETFSSAESEVAVNFGKGPQRAPIWPETILHQIDDVARTHANDPAILWADGESFSYGQMMDCTTLIANALVAAGITRGSPVAVMQHYTPYWISSILATMRIGAIYVPFDIANPVTRLAVMSMDCNPSLALVDEETRMLTSEVFSEEVKIINVSRLESRKSPMVPIIATANAVATVLYTSGSSGTPKGVMLTHEGLNNWFQSTQQTYDLGPECILQQSSSGFDMSLIQIFTALSLGGCVYLLPNRFRGDSRAISEAIYSQGITYTFACTSELFSWFKYGNRALLSRSNWRRAVAGGEPGVESLLDEFATLGKTDLRLFHAYGPTETSFTATTMELSYEATNQWIRGNIPVGYPLPNYSVYVLDDARKPVPPGVQGEIYIGGPGVAAGYWNNGKLTAEMFTINHLATPSDLENGWSSLYRTGDLGRWQEDGTILIEGRISGDTQVKLRGLRIDLREVERALVQAGMGTLSEVVVSAHRSLPGPGNPERLVAHVVFDHSCSSNMRTQLLEALPSRLGLPRYMCPAIIIPLDHMPKTISLKLDRRAIAALPLPEIASAQVYTLSGTQARLRSIWEDLIPDRIARLHSIREKTDFFQIGGTSLLLLSLRARIKAMFDVELRLVDLFTSSSLARMAHMIEKGSKQDLSLVQIDWERETSLPQELRGPVVTVQHAQETLKNVILTGATGYLGQALLQALVRDPGIREICCISVRDAGGLDQVSDLEKVSVHEGDLLLPRLGLSEHEAEHIFSTADLIIHNGADVSYMKTYESLRLQNLQSTKELAKMCLPRLIPIHYISSAGACSFAAAAGQDPIAPESVAGFPPPVDGTHGYEASKWASEVFLENLNARFPDWRVWIHRPSNITRTDMPQFDLVHNLRHYSGLMNAVPSLSQAALGQIDSVTLETVVQGVMNALEESRTGGARERVGVRYLHHIGGVGIGIDEVRSWALGTSQSQPTEMCEIPIDEWATLAGEGGMHPVLVEYLHSLGHHSQFTFPRLLKRDGGD
ncbi:amino acid adenylation domain-containing protein [Hypoxylon cercidicola]|nr:amino acid adenylation domain-containing protein [Hypoxylon cercidicola]